MLEYEKKLHLDEQWEKIKSCSIGSYIVSIIFGIILYAIIYAVLKKLLTFVPDIVQLNNSNVLTEFYGVLITFADVVYFAVGLALYLYGSIRYIAINKQNHSVREKSDTPTALLTTGCYAKVRHPMYGVFVIRSAAVLLSLRSWIGIALAIVFAVSQYLNALREEKKVLIILFGDSYRNYSKKTRHLLLKNSEVVLLALCLVISFTGMFI